MITVVTGLPRSGTSMMMQILSAGGMQLLTDNFREPDINNPNGYFEFEKVKSLITNNSWLGEAEDKAVKIIAQLIHFLPLRFNYKVILMEREIEEILLSQERMIVNLGGKQNFIGNDILKKTFQNHLKKAEEYILRNPCFKMIKINYNELMAGKIELIEKLNTELKLNLNIDKAQLSVEPCLYRSRIERIK